MNNDVITYLMKIADQNGILVHFLEELDPFTPPGTKTETRRIAMNANWHNKGDIPFQLAHELGHILSDQASTRILYYTPSKYGMELQANKYAIDMLLPLYLDGENKDDVNIHYFMRYFNIPSHLEEIVINETRKYFKN